MPDARETRPKRSSISDAEWRVSAVLVRGDVVIAETATALRLADSYLNGNYAAAGKCLAGFLDDVAQHRARLESAAKKATRRKR